MLHERVEGLRSAPEASNASMAVGCGGADRNGSGVVRNQDQPVAPPNPAAGRHRAHLASDLERYKATIKGLTQFGDRRQGTERNREAVDWIEAQLKSYGCPTERIKYTYTTPPPDARSRAAAAAAEPAIANAGERAPGGGRLARHPRAAPASTPIR